MSAGDYCSVADCADYPVKAGFCQRHFDVLDKARKARANGDAPAPARAPGLRAGAIATSGAPTPPPSRRRADHA